MSTVNIYQSQGNFIERAVENTVQYVTEPDRSLTEKVCAYAVFFFTVTLLTVSLIGAPIAFYTLNVWYNTSRQIAPPHTGDPQPQPRDPDPLQGLIPAAREAIERHRLRRENEVAEHLFGSIENYQRLPILDIGDRRPNSISREDFGDSMIYGGQSYNGRSFITCKIRTRGVLGGLPTIATFFEAYEQVLWITHDNGIRIINGGTFTNENIDQLKALIDGTHTGFRLG